MTPTKSPSATLTQWAIEGWAKGSPEIIAALSAADDRELTERAIAFSEANSPEGEEPQVTKTGLIVALIDMGLLNK
jgi:hypothetical protein